MMCYYRCKATVLDKNMRINFTHPELGKEVQALAGYYTAHEEHILSHNGREVLYIVGHVSIDAACCGTGNWNYIQIPGFLIQRYMRGSETTPYVSEIETIQEEGDRDSIRQYLRKEYPAAQIEFW